MSEHTWEKLSSTAGVTISRCSQCEVERTVIADDQDEALVFYVNAQGMSQTQREPRCVPQEVYAK